MKKYKSILANREIFIEAINKSNSITEMLILFGLRTAGGNYAAVKRHAKIHNVKLPEGNNTRIKKLNELNLKRRLKLEDVLVSNSTYCRYQLKKRLLSEGLLENICSECGLGPFWNGKPLALQIDHNNGIHNDNRIENLSIKCPNCHTQTKTFGSLNRKRSNIKNKKKTQLQKKFSIEKNRKFKLSKEELQQIIWVKPTQVIAKENNVSDKLIEKYCKRWNIKKPPRGYWAKLIAGKITK